MDQSAQRLLQLTATSLSNLSTSSKCNSPRELAAAEATAEEADEVKNSSCATSIKMALGVRKSCDGSIVSSMRKMSLSANSARNSREQLLEESDHQLEQPRNSNLMTATVANNQHQQANNLFSYPQANNQQQQQQDNITCAPPKAKASVESVVLKDAIQARNSYSHHYSNKLAVSNQSKPRSRSLIWRPHRKSSRASAQDSSECRVS